MTTRYAVYNPLNGETTLVDTKEEAVMLFWERMIDVSAPFFHNTMWMTVEQNEDGSEVWKNENDNVITKPLTVEEMTAIQQSHRVKKITNPTPVETMP
jgi:hypothetical protein